MFQATLRSTRTVFCWSWLNLYHAISRLALLDANMRSFLSRERRRPSLRLFDISHFVVFLLFDRDETRFLVAVSECSCCKLILGCRCHVQCRCLGRGSVRLLSCDFCCAVFFSTCRNLHAFSCRADVHTVAPALFAVAVPTPKEWFFWS